MRLGIVHTANHRHSRRAPRCNQEKSIHARSRAPVSAVDIARDLAHTFEAHVSDVDAVARLALASAALALKALHKGNHTDLFRIVIVVGLQTMLSLGALL